MFLSLMENIFMAKNHSLDSIRIRLNMIIVFHSDYCSLDSIELFNQIDTYLYQPNVDNHPLVIKTVDDIVKLNDVSWTSITVERNHNNMMRYSDYDYDYNDYPIFKLILNDYPHIQYINIENNSFQYIVNLTISNLPNLKLFKTGMKTFFETRSLTLSSLF